MPKIIPAVREGKLEIVPAQIIERCPDCNKNRFNVGMDDWYCYKQFKKLPKRTMRTGEFPKWCPLEDAPEEKGDGEA